MLPTLSDGNAPVARVSMFACADARIRVALCRVFFSPTYIGRIDAPIAAVISETMKVAGGAARHLDFDTGLRPVITHYKVAQRVTATV